MDAFTLLKNDHKKVAALFWGFGFDGFLCEGTVNCRIVGGYLLYSFFCGR